MRLSLSTFSFITGLLFCLNLQAQPTKSADIRPALKSLSTEQKLRLLEYIRFLGADLDKEVQFSFEQLNQTNREKATYYAGVLQKDAGNLSRTTVVWSRDTLRFGFLEEGTILLDSFVVTNTGKSPYVVTDIRTSCDCTVLKKPEFPVMPGESLTLRVEFNSSGKRGRSQPGIIVYDNSSPNLRNILYLDGEVVPRSTTGMQKD